MSVMSVPSGVHSKESVMSVPYGVRSTVTPIGRRRPQEPEEQHEEPEQPQRGLQASRSPSIQENRRNT